MNINENNSMIINLLYISTIVSLLNIVTSLEEPGRTNPKYKINNYFGSRYLSTFLSSTYLKDDPVIVTWSTGQYIHNKSSDKIFIANSNKNTIDYIDKENLHILVGIPNEPNYRDGDFDNGRFDSPRALVIYNESSFPNSREEKYKPFLFSLNKSSLIECKYATITNYSQCANRTYTLEQIAKAGDFTDINPSLVKLIKTNNYGSTDESHNNDYESYTYIFVADTNNHCIRKLNLVTSEVGTFAGVCKERGFKDGPLGINRFNQPQGLGIDSYGNIYVLDSGNKYMRIISPDGYVRTLIQGACFEYKFGEDIENNFRYKNKYLLCLKKWIKNSGEPTEHIYYSNDEDYCFENIVNCPNYLSNQKRKDS